MSLTPDLVEWLLADKKVCQRWKSLARRFNLGCYIACIERLCEDESGQLRLVLRLWQATSPHSYTVRECKSVLTAEGLHQMCVWLSLMTQTTTTHSTTLPSRQLTSHSPRNGYLYNQSLLHSSKAHSNTSDYYSYPSTPDTSRPSSRLSEYNNHSRSGSQQSDYNSSTNPYHQTHSCPTTPLTNRRNPNTPTTSYTKPGRITPSPYLTTTAPKAHSTIGKRRVYDLLYRPDLIKLSSPRIVRKAARKNEILNKVTEQSNGDYNQMVLKKYQSGSLPNLIECSDNCTSSMEIPFCTKIVKRSENKRKESDHEKEILKLCDEIIAEMKCNDPNVDSDDIYAIRNIRSDQLDPGDGVIGEAVGGKSDLVKVNYVSVNKFKTVQLSSINKEETEQNHDKTEKINIVSSTSEYFDNLVNIIEKAVQDLSTYFN